MGDRPRTRKVPDSHGLARIGLTPAWRIVEAGSRHHSILMKSQKLFVLFSSLSRSRAAGPRGPSVCRAHGAQTPSPSDARCSATRKQAIVLERMTSREVDPLPFAIHARATSFTRMRTDLQLFHSRNNFRAPVPPASATSAEKFRCPVRRDDSSSNRDHAGLADRSNRQRQACRIIRRVNFGRVCLQEWCRGGNLLKKGGRRFRKQSMMRVPVPSSRAGRPGRRR